MISQLISGEYCDVDGQTSPGNSLTGLGVGGDSFLSTGVRGLREDWARLAAQHNTDRQPSTVLSAHITHLGKLDLLSALTPSPHLTSPLTHQPVLTLHIST